MKSLRCSIALNVLVYRKHADILNLIIDFDNKLEDLCVHLLMLNINALEIHVALTGTCKNTEQGATPPQIDAIWPRLLH